MIRFIIRLASTFYHMPSKTQFNSFLDHVSGCFYGMAHVSEEIADELRKRPDLFEEVDDTTWAHMTTPTITAAPEPETGNPLQPAKTDAPPPPPPGDKDTEPLLPAASNTASVSAPEAPKPAARNKSAKADKADNQDKAEPQPETETSPSAPAEDDPHAHDRATDDGMPAPPPGA